MRIRLRFDPPELQDLPWELAYDLEKREFLTLSKRSLVTRYLLIPRPSPPLEIDPPLRILIAAADPQDQVFLDVGSEVACICQALHCLLDERLVSLLVEPHVTKRNLRLHLLDDAPHVLHYIGHGDLAQDRGVLLVSRQR